MLLHYVFNASFCPSCVTYRYLHIYVIPGDLGVLVGTIYVATMDRVECVTISLTRNWLFEIFISTWRGLVMSIWNMFCMGNHGGVVGLVHGCVRLGWSEV